MIQKVKIYVLGSSGFVGSAIEKHMLNKGFHVIGINRKNYGKYKNTVCDIFINSNGSSKKKLAEEDPQLDFELNVHTTLKTIFDFKFNKYILISTVDVYNNLEEAKYNDETTTINPLTLSNYGFDKWVTEQLVKKYCKSWLIFRLGGMVGGGLKKNAIYDLLNTKSLFVHPESEYQYINTREVAELIYKLKDRSKELFNVCGEGTIKLEDVAKTLKIKLDKRLYTLSKQCYKVNISKIKNQVKITPTKKTIEDFVRSYTKA